MAWSIALSLLLHFGIWLGLKSVPRPLVRPPLWVEVQPRAPGAPGTQRPARGGPSPSRPGRKRGGAKRGGLRDLSRLGVFAGGLRSGGSGRPGPKTSGDAFTQAEGMDVVAEGQVYSFMDALWRRIDAGVGYPRELVERRVTGDVEVQLVVDARGVLTGEVLDLRGPQPVLNTYVMAALYAALREAMPRAAWRREATPVPLLIRVHFGLFSDGNPPLSLEGPRHFKNLLSFVKSSHAPSLATQVMDEFMRELLPPVLPLPGLGAYIDFYRLYQIVNNWNRPTYDERREAKYRIRKDEWESAIRATGR